MAPIDIAGKHKLLDHMERVTKAAMPGPWFHAGWTEGVRGFEVGSTNGGRPRVCADMTQADAEYIAALPPEVVMWLINIARQVVPNPEEG